MCAQGGMPVLRLSATKTMPNDLRRSSLPGNCPLEIANG
jgi:hypothetical protein